MFAEGFEPGLFYFRFSVTMMMTVTTSLKSLRYQIVPQKRNVIRFFNIAEFW